MLAGRKKLSSTSTSVAVAEVGRRLKSVLERGVEETVDVVVGLKDWAVACWAVPQ